MALDFRKKILVTAALPYANGSIHLGHLVEYVQADVFVRFLRLSGRDVVFVCADDAHGAPIEIAASKQNVKPEELIAKYFEEHVDDFNDFFISFDSYHTTHSAENRAYSDFFFSTLKKKNLIYDRMVEQTYCESDKRFLPDRYVKGKCPKCGAEDQYGDQCEKCNSVYKPVDLIEPRCVVCNNVPSRKTSVHYFFRLKDFSGKLKGWIEGSQNIQPEIRNFALNWINSGLEDWDITRDGPYFGFKIPGEVNKYYYVWLDAPIGYIASTEKYCMEKLKTTATAAYWQKDTTIIHFIGKDIVYFHLLFWPAMLMGVGFTMPSDIPVHGHLTINGEKMSKSRGNFLLARDYLESYDPELLRFYYASNLSKTSADINLDFADFQSKVNNDLVSNIANFVYRTLSFVNNNFGSKISKVASADSAFVSSVQSKFAEVVSSYEGYDFRNAVRKILEISSMGNKYFQDNQPWQLVKTDKKRCSEVLAVAANIVRNLSILLAPILPKYSERIQKQLGLPQLSFADLNFGFSNAKINMARIIFTHLEEVSGLVPEAFPADLKVALVDSVDEHPDAEKLYVLQVSIGSEKRQLVAGLRPYLGREELVGKKIVVVANLKPAKIRGVESNGMLLAADKDGKVVPLTAENSSTGDSVVAEGLPSSAKRISAEEFHALNLRVESKNVFYGDRVLRTAKEALVVDIADGATIR